MKKVLVFGAGMVARPLVRYLLARGHEVTVATRTVAKAERIIGGHQRGHPVEFMVDNIGHMSDLVKATDLAISLLPYVHHVSVARLCIKYGKHMVTTSYVSPEMASLDEDASSANILILNECGLDPGIDHMGAMEIIDDIHKRSGKVMSFISYCGGLPAPEANTNPWGYKFSWSAKGVVLAGRNSASYLWDGNEVTIPSKELFTSSRQIHFPGLGAFDGYPNRDSVKYVGIYGIEGAKTVLRGTLRNPGWCEAWKKMVDLGFIEDVQENLGPTTYRKYLSHLLDMDGSEPLSEEVQKVLCERLGLEMDAPFVNKLNYIGFFGDDVMDGDRNRIDILADRLEEKLFYLPEERDMVALIHEFEAYYPESDLSERIICTFVDYGEPRGDSAMARTVGLPAAIAAHMILEGVICLKGVHRPLSKEIYEPILSELEDHGMILEVTRTRS